MKKFFLFMFAALAFAACEQAPIEEQSAILQDATKSITVGFEGDDDTRIQLNEAQKTVWTEGDHVSVFYRSNVNEEWQFMGETGDRTGQIVPVDNSVDPPATHNRVVVIYPYNNEYYLNTETYSIEASLPAVQNYLEDSYGTNGNIMVSSNDYKQVSLKSVCGWLKLQLTGDGEVVKSITLRGNNGEQVAGELHINTSDATCVLASASGDAGDSEVGGTLVRPGTMLTEVTLDCGEGVALGKEATAFYIALPPQTFEKGFKVEILCADDTKMVKSSNKALSIQRNHIQPMTAMEFTPSVPNNQIWYTSYYGDIVEPNNTNAFGANIVSNTYTNGKGVITFDGDVTTIGYVAFTGCDSLTSVTIPDSITTIGEGAFDSCYSLTSVNIPDSVTTIGEGAFRSCSSLTSVNIPDSVTTIEEGAFRYCYSLTSVTIPDSVTTIGDAAFADCDSLTEFKGKFALEDGRCLIIDGVLNSFAPYGLTQYTIPDTVTTIGSSVFDQCDSLTSITIPDSVTTIGSSAFNSCISLTSVTIGDSVMSIGSRAFTGCDSLTSVTIPDSVTEIGNYAFTNCYSLTSVTIGDSVTSIGDRAFSYCNSLTSVTIPDSVTEIGNYAFSGCESLTEFKGKFASEDGRCLIIDGVLNSFAPNGMTQYTIPDSVTTIGEGAFQSCDSLTSVTIGDSVTSIGDSAFYSCDSLTSVTIGDSVTEIGSYAFQSCYSLTSVYCKATTPPALGGTYVFDNNGSGRKIYVPVGSVEAYKSATNWSEYADAIVGYDFENGVVME